MRFITVSSAILLALSACTPKSERSGGHMFMEMENSPKVLMDQEIEERSKGLHYYLAGQLALMHQEFPAALQNFSKASELIKEDAPALHAELAELYVRDGKLEEALAQVNKALALSPDNEHYLLLSAGILEGMGRLDEAEGVYRKLAAAFPQNFESRVLLSAIYAKRGAYDEAIAVLKEVVKQPAYETMGRYYLGHIYEQKGDAKAAEQEYLAAYDKGGDGVNLIADILRLYLSANDIKKAEQFSRRVIKNDQNNLIARRVLAQLLMGEKRFDEALEHLAVLTSIETEPEESRLKMALICLEKQDYKKAEEELNLILKNKPDYPEARYYLGSVYAAMGRIRDAVQELSKIQGGSDLGVRARIFSAALLREEKDFRGAEAVLREALQADPDNDRAIAYLITVFRESKKFQDASSFIEAAIERRPQNEELWFQYGVLLSEAGRDGEALQKMQQVLALNPDHADALNFVAYSYAQKGENLEGALQMVQKALKIKGNDGYYLDTLAWVYYRMGRLDEALRESEKSVGIVKNDVVILEHYGDILMKKGKIEKALQVYRSALELPEQENESPEEVQALERLKKKIERGQMPDQPAVALESL